MRCRAKLFVFAIVTASVFAASLSAAQSTEATEATEATEESEESEAKAAARAHFLRGLSLLREQAFDAALVEFSRSRALYPTRGNALNAAVALRELGRYDEALAIFHELLSDKELSDEERERLTNEVRVLEGLLGRVTFTGLVPGAHVLVDGRQLGLAPLDGPLLLSAGTRLVRVLATGFVPFERRVDVPAGGEVNVVVTPVAVAGAVTPRLPPKPREGFEFDLGAYFAFSSGLESGGSTCLNCSVTPAMGGLAVARLSYQFGNGFGFGAEGGTLLDWKRRKNEALVLGNERFADLGSVVQTTVGKNALFGVSGSYRHDKKVNLVAGLSLGVGLGQLDARRQGIFHTSQLGTRVEVDARERHLFPSIYLGPFFRASLPVDDHVNFFLELRVQLIGVVHVPRWRNDRPVAAAEEGNAVFTDDNALRETFVMLLAPGAGFTYEL